MRLFNLRTLIALFLVALSTSAFAQTTWTYKQYNLKFTTPANFKVTANDDKSFVANDGKAITFSLYPYKDATVTKEKIADLAWSKINATEKTKNRSTTLSMEGGYEGYYMTGKGKQNGKELVFIAFGCIDTQSSVNFYSIIYFWNDANATANTDTAINIFKSFKRAN